MTKRRLVETDRFRAIGTDGRTYVVIEEIEEVEFQTLQGETRVARGLRQYRLEDGHPVNVRPSGGFDIVGRGVTVTRV